jgi:outer membrane protein
MRIHPMFAACLVLLTFGAGRACAQAQTHQPVLTLAEAQQITITNHPRITAAELMALASKQVVRESRSAYFPSVFADATAVGTDGSNTRLAAGALNNPLILQRNAEGVTASEIITDFGRTMNLTASSKAESHAEEAGALATREEILLELDSAFFDTLSAQSVLDVARQTVATRQLTFDQISELAKNKLRSSLDVSFADVDLQNANVLLVNASNDVQASFVTLYDLLGQRDQPDYRLIEVPLPSLPAQSDTDLVQTALRDRPDLAQLRFESDAAGRFARAENDLNYPTISAMGSAGVVPIGDSTLRENYAAAGVNLSIPIFEGMLISAKKDEAELRAKAAAEKLRDAEDNMIRDLRIAIVNLRYAADRMALTEKLLASANEAFELAQARYKVGSSSIVELSQAQLNQTEAQIANTRAKYDFQTRNSILNYQLGRTP